MKRPSVLKVLTFGSSAIFLIDKFKIRRFPSISHEKVGFVGKLFASIVSF
jgi:hypothetical protein